MIWLILIAAGWFFLIMYLDLSADLEKWENDVPVEHSKEAGFRIALLTVSWLLFAIPVSFSLWGMIATTAAMFFWYWTLFDGLYNICRGFEWFFAGSDDPDDAGTDNFLQWVGPTWHRIIKVGGILLSTIGYLLTL